MSMDHPPQAVDVQVLVSEARALVLQLYDPANTGNPTKIKVIQEHLQTLQKGPHAWIIANSLLADESTDLRFFGALTFTVKVNHNWHHLTADDTRELIGRLIDHYVALVNAGERPLVIRKLASSLATIFLKAGAPWTRSILSLGASLASGKSVREEDCQSITLQDAILSALAENQVVSLLYFSNILAEEINRLGSESRRSDDVHRISENIKDAFLLVEFVLSQILQQNISGSGIPNEVPGAVALDSYQSWIAVRSSFQLHDAITATQLVPATNCVIHSLVIPSLSKTASRILIEAMGWRDSMLTPEHVLAVLDYIISDAGTAYIALLMEGDFDDENIVLLELLLAFSSLRRTQLLTQPLDDKHEKVVALLHTLFKAPGYAAVDDSAAPLVLEWWTEAADDLQGNLLESEEQNGINAAKQNLARVTLDCFEKLKYPLPEELREWSDDDRTEFGSFRRDVCDFLLAIYPILGIELVHVFQAQARNSLTSQDWRTFEAAIFCVAQLSEAVDENQHADECLNSIFFCDEFSRLCEGDGVTIPDKARQTLVDMLGKYQSYFERTQALLPRVLTFLFSSLDVAPCASAASKSVAYLCKSCRNALRFELPAFISQFEQFRYKSTATTQTLEKVLEGIAAIIQVLPADEEKSPFLERILKFFHEQAELARSEAAHGSVETARNRGHMVLRCLASIGRGLRADGEVVLDSGHGKAEDPYPPTFWNTGNGSMSQSLIMQCMRLLMTDFPFDVAIIEATCDILKAGFTESTGPYVFPPPMTVDFVKSIPLGTAGTDMVMGTASAFLASHGAHPQKVSEEAVALILRVYDTFCWVQEKPELYDPEIANSGIDFLTRLLPKYYPYLFALTYTPQGAGHRPPVIRAISNFTLLSLQGTEPIPLRSASQFWVSVLNLPTEAKAVQNTILEYLPALCRILVAQVAGRCARSDLEHLTDVLRRVVFKQQGHARPHLTAALADIGNDQTDQGHATVPSPEERQRFLSSLFAARGVRTQTLQLVRAFWVKCRGAGFDYIG
ncbi:armadillo-type protein [Aspergillus pseudoustus]|uniref:Armadillo-type protein n=1 Tax=Aspergillus pseudoustus TaxID=1810923 RepID=A0ABR4JIR3_9EURO